MRERGPAPSCQVSGGTEPGFTLKKLNPDDYHEICGMVENLKTIIPDEDHYFKNPYYWRSGQRVLLADGKDGVITGFAVDVDTRETSPFARVDGRLYHVRTLKML